MKTLSFTLVFILFQILPLTAQSSFANKVVVGTSMTFIADWVGPSLFDENALTYKEWTWHKNIAVNLNKNIYVGINLQNIYTKGSLFDINSIEEKNQYYIAGLFGQYYLSVSEKWKLFGELSWNRGNYCNCELDRDAYEVEKLNYIGFGAGFDYALTEKLHLDVAMTPYLILHKSENSNESLFTHPQYIIGLNYEFQIRN